jgi:hypothetical protein
MSEELTRTQSAEEQQDEPRSEQRGAALPEGRAGGQRGETARLSVFSAAIVSSSTRPSCAMVQS